MSLRSIPAIGSQLMTIQHLHQAQPLYRAYRMPSHPLTLEIFGLGVLLRKLPYSWSDRICFYETSPSQDYCLTLKPLVIAWQYCICITTRGGI